MKITTQEKQWIKICKGHLSDQYPFEGTWVKTLKPLFKTIYGWDPDSDYQGYLNCIFSKLLDIQFKISDDESLDNRQLKDIFYDSFSKSISRTDELPIERAISSLCGTIQGNLYQNEKYRYELD